MGEGEEDIIWYGENIGEKKAMSLATAKTVLVDTIKLVYVAYSHYELVHNDIRPENVMVSHVQLDRPEAYLLDLGLTNPVGADGALACCNLGSLCTAPPESVFAFGTCPPSGYSASSGLVYTLSALIMYVLSRYHVFIPKDPQRGGETVAVRPRRVRAQLQRVRQEQESVPADRHRPRRSGRNGGGRRSHGCRLQEPGLLAGAMKESARYGH